MLLTAKCCAGSAIEEKAANSYANFKEFLFYFLMFSPVCQLYYIGSECFTHLGDDEAAEGFVLFSVEGIGLMPFMEPEIVLYGFGEGSISEGSCLSVL